MLLQIEVNKAKDAVKLFEEAFHKEKKIVQGHAKLLTDPAFKEFEKHLSIERLDLDYENIAGIEVPHLKEVFFKEGENFLLYEPYWIDEMIHMLRMLIKAYQKTLISKKRKELLENELRIVSIRVNLFEKRLIPEIEKDINKIRVFLGDQDLQAIGGAKVSKKKILDRISSTEEIA